MVGLSSVICRLDLAQFSLSDGASVVPRFTRSLARCAFPRGGLVGFGRAIPRAVCFCTVATCCTRFALSSYVAISLTIIALLQSALPVVSLALKHFALPDETFVNDLVCIFGVRELDNDGRG